MGIIPFDFDKSYVSINTLINLTNHVQLIVLDPWPCAGYTLSPASGVGRQLLVVNLRAVDIRVPIGESLIVFP